MTTCASRAKLIRKSFCSRKEIRSSLASSQAEWVEKRLQHQLDTVLGTGWPSSIEMGRRLRMARVARVCPLCPGMHVGDERQYVFECPAFDDIRRGFQQLFDDSHGHHFLRNMDSCMAVPSLLLQTRQPSARCSLSLLREVTMLSSSANRPPAKPQCIEASKSDTLASHISSRPATCI